MEQRWVALPSGDEANDIREADGTPGTRERSVFRANMKSDPTSALRMERCRVFRAETGDVHDIETSPSTSVSEFKAALWQQTRVTPSNQILVYEGMGMEGDAKLERYGLPSEQRPVFMFDKSAFGAASPPPLETVLELSVVTVPKPKFVGTLAGAAGASQKIVHEFTYHVEVAKAAISAADDAIALCVRCIAQQEVMVRAIDAISANLCAHDSHLARAAERVQAHMNVYRGKYDELLEGFEASLAKLLEVKLHAALQTETVRTLADCVPEARLRAWASECAANHGHISARGEELQGMAQRIHEDAREELRVTSDFRLDIPRQHAEHAVRLRHDLRTIKRDLSADLRVARECLEAARSGRDPGVKWKRMQEDPDRIAHTTPLSRVVAIQQDIRQAMKAIAHNKTRISVDMQSRLKRVSAIQGRIREALELCGVLDKALTSQKRDCSHLVYVRYLPEAYAAGLRETARRKAFGTEFRAALQRMSAGLLDMCAREKAERERFLQKYGRYIPRNLIPGLAEGLPDVSKILGGIVLDGSLPDIDGVYPEGHLSHDFSLIGSGGTVSTGPPCVDGTLLVDPPSGGVAVRRDGAEAVELACAETDGSAVATKETETVAPGSHRGDPSKTCERSDPTQPPDIEGILSAYRKRIHDLEETVASSSASSSSAARKREDRIAQLEAECARMRQMLSEAEERTEATHAHRGESDADAPVAGKGMEDMERRIRDGERRFAEVQASLSMKEGQVSALRARLDSMVEAEQKSLESSLHQEGHLIAAREDLRRATSERDALASRVEELERERTELRGTVHVLRVICEEHEVSGRQMAANIEASRQEGASGRARETRLAISCTCFQVDDVAVFLPCNDRRAYKAFHRDDSHYYLGSDAMLTFGDLVDKGLPILGQIVLINPKTANHRENPHGLRPGTRWHEVTISAPPQARGIEFV